MRTIWFMGRVAILLLIACLLASFANIEYSERHLYIKHQDYKYAKYETAYCYLGADISKDNIVKGNITSFEDMLGNHAIMANSIKMGEAYPYDWMLSCVAKMKLPFLTIYPPNTYAPFQLNMLESMVKQASELNIPMFISFYPYDEDDLEVNEYISYYRKAYNLFKTHVPKAAFVWTAKATSAETAILYYPGDKYVDWVGIDIMQSPIEQVNYDAIDYIYYTFQKKKPIAMQISLSHFSKNSATYHTEQVAESLLNIYNNLYEKYIRVKSAIYISQQLEDNYLLTDESAISESYKIATKPDIFLREPIEDTTDEYLLSPFPLYYSNGEWFISEMSIKYDLNLSTISLYDLKINIKGKKYYNAKKALKRLSVPFEIDKNGNIISN